MELPSFQDLERQRRNNFSNRSSFYTIKKLGPPYSKDLNFLPTPTIVVFPTITPTLTQTPTPTPSNTSTDRCRAINPNFHEYDFNDCLNDSTKQYVTTSFPALPNVICYGCIDKNNVLPTSSFRFVWNAGCIYPGRNCNWPYNFIISTNVINPFNTTANVLITGSVDDDLWVECGSFKRWARSGGTIGPGPGANALCTAGSVLLNFSVSANESIKLEVYDVRGICGGVDILGTFTPASGSIFFP